LEPIAPAVTQITERTTQPLKEYYAIEPDQAKPQAKALAATAN
jgi:hypothetical protein